MNVTLYIYAGNRKSSPSRNTKLNFIYFWKRERASFLLGKELLYYKIGSFYLQK